MSRKEQVLARVATAHLDAGERLDLVAEVLLGEHLYLSQMLNALTMGGPKPRTQRQLREPNHGILVLSDRRLLLLGTIGVVRQAARGTVRAVARGGTPVIPWLLVRWAGSEVRVGFHWDRRTRDRLWSLLTPA